MGAPERTQTRQQIQWLPLRRLQRQRPGVHPHGHSTPGRRHVNDPRGRDKAREGRIPSVFRPKRNDEGRVAARFSRDASPFESRVTFATGC